METLTRGLSDDTWSKCGSLPFILTQSCGEPLPFCSHRAPPVTGVPRTHSGTCHSRPRGHRTRGHHSSIPRGSWMLLLSPPRWELKIRCSRHRRHSSLLHPGRGLWFGMIAPRPPGSSGTLVSSKPRQTRLSGVFSPWTGLRVHLLFSIGFLNPDRDSMLAFHCPTLALGDALKNNNTGQIEPLTVDLNGKLIYKLL